MDNSIIQILIVGTGQLGSRHLQGILNQPIKAKIYLFDKNEDSIKIALDRANEVFYDQKSIEIVILKSMNEIPKHLHFCIIATTVQPRFQIFKSLISNHSIDYFILEKLLFADEVEYLSFNQLYSQQTNIFINCPRRMFKDYKKLKRKIGDEEIISISVDGHDWNLASNAIHFLDLIQFITDSEINLDFGCRESLHLINGKREGSKELRGKIRGNCGKVSFEMTSSEIKKDLVICFNIRNGQSIILNETKGTVKYNLNHFSSENNFNLPYQSELSGSIINQLIENKQCDLPNLSNVYNLHKDYHSFLVKSTDFSNFPFT